MEPTQLAATTRNEVGLDIDRISGPLVQWFLPGKHQNCRHTRGRACHRSVTGAHAAATGGCSLWMLHHIKPPMSQPVARGPITGIRSPASSRWLPLFSGFGFVFVLRSLSQPRPGSGTCTHTSAPYIPPPTHDHSTQPLVSSRFGFLFTFFFFPFLLLRFAFPLSLSPPPFPSCSSRQPRSISLACRSGSASLSSQSDRPLIVATLPPALLLTAVTPRVSVSRLVLHLRRKRNPFLASFLPPSSKSPQNLQSKPPCSCWCWCSVLHSSPSTKQSPPSEIKKKKIYIKKTHFRLSPDSLLVCARLDIVAFVWEWF